MQDYAISKSTRKCSATGKQLEPGEAYVSAILPDGESVRRVDIAATAWRGPDPDTIGWWKCRVPEASASRLRPAPNGVLLDTLSELVERPDKSALSYLLALLLVRRRILTDDESLSDDSSPSDAEATTSGVWSLTCPADGRVWHVPMVAPEAAQLDELRDELNRLLFTEE